MSDIDRLCMQAVDELAAELLELSPTELLARPDYGVFDQAVDGETFGVGFWHYERGIDHHIHFKLTRRLARRWSLFTHKSYVSGVVFGPESSPRLMTPNEVGEYL